MGMGMGWGWRWRGREERERESRGREDAVQLLGSEERALTRTSQSRETGDYSFTATEIHASH